MVTLNLFQSSDYVIRLCFVIILAGKSDDPEIQKIVSNTKALVMLGVPHGGSDLATLNVLARFLFLPSVEVQELQKGILIKYYIWLLDIKSPSVYLQILMFW